VLSRIQDHGGGECLITLQRLESMVVKPVALGYLPYKTLPNVPDKRVTTP
jgi:hypothetical protein